MKAYVTRKIIILHKSFFMNYVWASVGNLIMLETAGVVPCDIHNKRPRTSSIVQFIFYFLVL